MQRVSVVHFLIPAAAAIQFQIAFLLLVIWHVTKHRCSTPVSEKDKNVIESEVLTAALQPTLKITPFGHLSRTCSAQALLKWVQSGAKCSFLCWVHDAITFSLLSHYSPTVGSNYLVKKCFLV